MVWVALFCGAVGTAIGGALADAIVGHEEADESWGNALLHVLVQVVTGIIVGVLGMKVAQKPGRRATRLARVALCLVEKTALFSYFTSLLVPLSSLTRCSALKGAAMPLFRWLADERAWTSVLRSPFDHQAAEELRFQRWFKIVTVRGRTFAVFSKERGVALAMHNRLNELSSQARPSWAKRRRLRSTNVT